ncbi:2-methylcitrate dehydratase PrpD [Paraburkholderia sp. MM5496-R1]|uniref:MmgE/PrpD family protein n=1 Tax=Paraburkholderia sp. MM5496-R1 TaxID=2991065 RepID=UPI003D222DEF
MTTPTFQDLGFDLANFSVDARYESILADAVDAAKKSLLDLIGVTLAASGVEPVARTVIDVVRENGGRPESSVLGFADRVPAAWAAFANGAMAHCLDFDDLTPWGAHATSSILPAAFAIAERRGGVSGREMITAIAVGQDIFARMRRNIDWRKDWNISTVLGVFAATAAAGRLLGLSRTQMANALSVASMQSAGTMDVVYGIGGDLRCIYAGFSAKAAVVAALLAEKGVVGTQTAFEGEYGFFKTYFGGRYDRENLLKGLGSDYMGNTTLYKPWPAVGPSHSHIYATIQLVTANNLRPEDIQEIRVHVGDYHEIMCSPLDSRRAPATLVDAKFSLPFLVAVAAVRRDVTIADFTGNALHSPEVLAVSKKVIPIADPAFDWKMELPLGQVEIIARDGRRLSQIGTKVPGSPEAPMSWEDIMRKFANCAALAATPPSIGQIEKVQQMVRQLESLDDVTELLRCLA